jgi:CDP-diacylglycerol---serine O-phosphatidyltransferase
MQTKRALRYLAPNLVTLGSLLFGMAAIVATVESHYVAAAWFIVFSVLTDKLDGFVARLVKGASEFGVQLDSFADFLNFGIAPAALWYAYLTRPESPIGPGAPRALLLVSLIAWVLAVVFRLARYNIVGCDPRCKRIFFGVPTTLMGGLLIVLFLTFLKYGGDIGGQALIEEPHLPGLVVTPSIWKAWPFLVLLGAYLMASGVKIPKLGLSRSKALTVFIGVNVVLGFICGATRHFPEYLVFDAGTWVIASLIWAPFSKATRGLKPPPIFPQADPPLGQEPTRPEEDALPDGDDGDDEDEEPAPRPAA